MMNRRKCWLFRLLVCSPILLAELATVSQVQAVDIVLSYDAALSEPPSFDADASRLTALMNSAAAVFEDIIEDDWTLNLAYTWGDLGDDGYYGSGQSESDS